MVFHMSICPSGSMLASIDVSGSLSLWELPSFRLKRRWTPQELVSDIHRHHFSLIMIYASLSLSLHTQPQVADSDTHSKKGKLGHQVVCHLPYCDPMIVVNENCVQRGLYLQK